MKEEWKSIREIEGYSDYRDLEVSNLGEFRQRLGAPDNRVYPAIHKGYLRIKVKNRNSERCAVYRNVHRIVALAFLKNDYEKLKKESGQTLLIVHHRVFDEKKQELKLNNEVTNLQWVTQREHSLIHKKKSST